jgi:hypothetical protein
VTRALEFVMGQATFSKGDVALTPSFQPAFWLRISGFTNEDLGLTTQGDLGNSPNPAPAISASVNATLNLPNNLTSSQLATISANLPTVNQFGTPLIVPADPMLQQDPPRNLAPEIGRQ